MVRSNDHVHDTHAHRSEEDFKGLHHYHGFHCTYMAWDDGRCSEQWLASHGLRGALVVRLERYRRLPLSGAGP